VRQTAKPHPTDARDQAWIAEAIYFTAFCQRGPRDRRRVQVDVTDDRSRDMALTDAKAKGQALANEMGKAAMVYAVTAAGRSAHVCSIYPEAVGGPQTMKTTDNPQTFAYPSKKAATEVARATLGPDARFTTDKGPLGWTFTAMPAADPVLDAMAQMDAAEADAAIFGTDDQLPAGVAAAGLAEAMGGPLATEAVAADKAAAADPLVVDGVRYPNPTRAKQARRDATNRAAALTIASKSVTADKAKPKAAPKAKAKPAPAAPKAAAPAAGKRAQVLADAQRGIVPAAPDFSADTHKRYRAQLVTVQTMAAQGDVKGLKAEVIKTSGSSGKALDRFRQLAIIAIEAGAGKGGAA
jgi:hypothetical protein